MRNLVETCFVSFGTKLAAHNVRCLFDQTNRFIEKTGSVIRSIPCRHWISNCFIEDSYKSVSEPPAPDTGFSLYKNRAVLLRRRSVFVAVSASSAALLHDEGVEDIVVQAAVVHGEDHTVACRLIGGCHG